MDCFIGQSFFKHALGLIEIQTNVFFPQHQSEYKYEIP